MSFLPIKKEKTNKEKRKKSFLFGDYFSKIKLCFYSFACNDIKRICMYIYKKEKYFCRYDLESKEVQNNISNRREKAEKFEQIEEIAPVIKERIDSADYYEKKLEFCSERLVALYVAYKTGNSNKVDEIFQQFIDAELIKINLKKG